MAHKLLQKTKKIPVWLERLGNETAASQRSGGWASGRSFQQTHDKADVLSELALMDYRERTGRRVCVRDEGNQV